MIKQEWTALQNLPSLPRDLTTVDLGVGLETEDASAMIPFGDESAGAVAAMAPTAPPPMDDRDEDAVRLARSRAATARLRAKEARSIATQKTATATALTIQAKEMLDAAATVGEDVGVDPEAAFDAMTHSGLRTPTAVSERGGWGGHFDGFDAQTALSGDAVSSPAVVCGEVKSSSRVTTPARVKSAAADSSDDEESVPASRSSKRKRKGEAKVTPPKGPQATDSIVTANGKKIRRGCLNCGQQKTPQWRMGPEGPKTLCNACGVRFRKGLPLDRP